MAVLGFGQHFDSTAQKLSWVQSYLRDIALSTPDDIVVVRCRDYVFVMTIVYIMSLYVSTQIVWYVAAARTRYVSPL